jgi:CoA-transferase family III/Protein of unknown function (DUF1275)
MSLPLEGIKVIDFTGVQAGPACTQLLAWFGADVLKVERPGVGDVTRHQLRDSPDIDALYFTMLNSNKRSLGLDTKTPEGKAVMEKLIRGADVLVENFGPARVPVELPLLALAMAMQGETIARFGGISLQKIVATNNMVKFSDALVGRYLSRNGKGESQDKKPELEEVLMPGLAWLTYSIGAATGALALGLFQMPLALPAMLLVFIVVDLMATRSDTVPVAG